MILLEFYQKNVQVPESKILIKLDDIIVVSLMSDENGKQFTEITTSMGSFEVMNTYDNVKATMKKGVKLISTGGTFFEV